MATEVTRSLEGRVDSVPAGDVVRGGQGSILRVRRSSASVVDVLAWFAGLAPGLPRPSPEALDGAAQDAALYALDGTGPGVGSIVALLLAAGASADLRHCPRWRAKGVGLLHLLCGGATPAAPTRALDLAAADADLAVFAARCCSADALEARDGVHGATPLVWAAWYGRPHSVAALLRHGANPAAVDGYGASARDYAVRHGSEVSVAILTALDGASAGSAAAPEASLDALRRSPAVASVVERDARARAARAALAFAPHWVVRGRSLPANCLGSIAHFAMDDNVGRPSPATDGHGRPTEGWRPTSRPRVPRDLAERDVAAVAVPGDDLREDTVLETVLGVSEEEMTEMREAFDRHRDAATTRLQACWAFSTQEDEARVHLPEDGFL